MRRLARSFALAIFLTVVAAPARGATDPNDLRSQQWALDKIGAPAAWPVADGTGVIVAVVDTGADYTHDDLKGQLLPGHDFVDNDDDAQDADGHGTHVSGIIAAIHGNGGTDGVAPGAKILPVRVLDENGYGSDATVVAGIQWAVSHGAKVVNLSLGEGGSEQIFGPSLAKAVNDAWKAGAICVIAAGNEFVTSSAFTDEPAVVVTATDRNDNSPTYASGVGDAKWGIAAPGGEVPTPVNEQDAILSTYWVQGEKDQYAYLAGTSQAAPHVSAALALLLSTGKFTPAQAVQRMLDTAKDIGAPGRDTLYGYGLLDVAAAVKGLSSASSGTPSTTAGSANGGTATTTASGGTNSSSATTALAVPNLSGPTVLPDGPADSPDARGPEVNVAAGATAAHHRSGRTVPTVFAALVLVAVTASAIRWRRGRPVTDDDL